MTLTDAELKEIEERVKAATPGPWKYEKFHGAIEYVTGGGLDICENPAPNNADLIANAPQDLTRLIAEVRRLQNILKRIETGAECSACSCSCHKLAGEGVD